MVVVNPGVVTPGTIVTADLADGAVTSAKIADGTIATADLADQAVTLRKASDALRTGGWARTGAIGQALPRQGVVSSAGGTSGTLNLSGGVVLPAGRVVSSISFAAAAAAAAMTAQWFAIYDALTLALLATTVDDGANAWPSSTEKTLLLATALRGAVPGGTYTPVTDQLVYLGVCQNGGTPATLRSLTGSSVLQGYAPILTGPSNLALASGVANAPDPCIAPVPGNAFIEAWVS